MKLHERVASRYVEKQGKVHATPEAREKYLKEHPKADPNKHTVKGDKGKGDKPKGQGSGKPAVQRATEDKIFKGWQVSRMSQKDQNKMVEELSKRPESSLRQSVWTLDMEEKDAQDKGDKKKLQEIWAKQNIFNSALLRTKNKSKKA